MRPDIKAYVVAPSLSPEGRDLLTVDIYHHFLPGFGIQQCDWDAVRSLSSNASFRASHPRQSGELTTPYLIRLESEALEVLKPGALGMTRLGCLIFGQSPSKTVREDIAPRFDYWHHRSGRNVDFCCIGFGKSGQTFCDASLVKAIQLFETETNWRYSGETDFLALNFRVDTARKSVVPDWSTVVSLTLERVIEDKAISSVSTFFEDLIRFTERFDGADPAWGFSDALGTRVVGSALKRLLLSTLPESLREDARRAFHVHVKDISIR